MDADTPAASSSTMPTDAVELRASHRGRVSGKAWKSTKVATRRSYISPSIKTSFAKRKEQEKERDAVKAVEREMKEEKEAEAERRRTAIKERRERQAEKKRLEEVAAKMSAKKAQRMKKRLGRSKKING